MNFEDMFVFKSERFSVGQELESGKYYLSILVSNSFVDHEQYYEITQDEFDRFLAGLKEMRDLAEQARARKIDSRLMTKPGRIGLAPGIAPRVTANVSRLTSGWSL